MYDHLSGLERTTKKRDTRLDVTPIPEAGAWYWWLFKDLSRDRGNNGFGPCPITLASLKTWMEINNEALSRYDRDVIFMIDNAYLRAVSQANKR